ncbi:hypothetical protein B9Z55_010834 [Caenorhabditis nigoni]|uniref:GTP-binding protein Rheb n=1 Tax=Caenorhabditis nigoni TaxID=1611254 RepID=A0A2G5UIH4_9PELO|nr:hypothetical protein B9Z55_010834 [Caenorhabditis nigoni]
MWYKTEHKKQKIKLLSGIVTMSSSTTSQPRYSLNRKVAVMGYPHVGKSSIVQRFTQNMFPDRYETTIEDQHTKHHTAFHRDFNLRVTDTAGQQEYTVFPRSCSLDVAGFLLVYAIDDRKSFDICSSIYEKIISVYGDPSIPIIIVGNKCDLGTQRVVQQEEGKELAKQCEAKFVEITARETNRVNEVFELLLREIEISRGNLRGPPQQQTKEQTSSDPNDPKNCVIS